MKRLFWELLGYDRRDEAVSIASLGADLRSSVLEARLFASHDKFHLYHLSLTAEGLNRPVLRRLYRLFRRKHRFVALIFSNADKADWHLAYQPEDLGHGGCQGRLATIRLGHGEEKLRRKAHALHKLRIYDDDDEPLSVLELAAAYDGIFAEARPRAAATASVRDDIGILLSEIGRYPLLTARRERAILEELEGVSTQQFIWQGGRVKRVRVPLEGCEARYKELRDMLVVHNLRLCFSLSKRDAINQGEIPDLFQESVIGLYRAIDLVEPARNFRFTTYAYQWIRQAITRWIANHRLLIRRPEYLHRLPREIRPRISTISLDGSGLRSPYDLTDGAIRTSSSDLEEAEEKEIIMASLRTLRKRQAVIISQLFGLDGSKARTLEEVARSCRLTRERIRQIEAKALGELRLLLRGRLDNSNGASSG